MICSNCGNICAEESRYCSNCGKPLYEIPKPRHGSLWVPLLIMVLLCTLGLILFFTVPMSGAPAGAETDISCFSVDNGTLYFDASRYTGNGELTVPNTLSGQQITALSDGCFENCDLTAIHLPDSITFIGKGAFRGCRELRGLQIPGSVERIGIEAFFGCALLEAVSLTDNLEYIGPGAFTGCDQLHYIMFSGSHMDWIELYDEFINPYTAVICDDGSFYQGKPAE